MQGYAILRLGLFALGAAAIAISLLITVIGAQGTAALFVFLLSAVAPQPPIDGLSDPNTDSELRFYAVLWFCYGLIAIRTGRALPAAMAHARALLVVFLAGGVGRAFSYLLVGPPHPLFVILMAIELAAAPALIALTFLSGPRPDDASPRGQ